jgi:methionyl aminopeptidase
MKKPSAEILLKSPEEIETIRAAGKILHDCLAYVRKAVEPKVRTRDLDALAEEFIRSHDATPSFKGYGGFPGSLCISVNEEVVHGIPNGYKVKNGDILSIDCGVTYRGLIADSATTVAVGDLSDEHQRLLRVTEESLYLGIAQAVIGNHVVDIARAIQEHVENAGFSVVRELVGHGVGFFVHEEPQVPNFVTKGHNGAQLTEGLVIAIEPMVNLGTYAVNRKKDGWTIVTADKMPSAHFEHTIAITKNGPDILTNGI